MPNTFSTPGDANRGEVERDRPGGGTLRLRTAGVGALALAVGMAAALLGHAWFPELSGNNDEPVYLFQADRALDGEYTFPADAVHADVLRVWLSGPSDGQVVFPFNPPYPSFLALTGGGHGWRWLPRLLTGAMIVPALWAAFAHLGQRRARILALVLALASPLLVVQSALFLPYITTLTLELVAFAALLTAVRRHVVGWSVVAGVAWSLAFWTRPFDALLTASAIALALFVGRDTRHDRGRILHHALVTGAAAIPVLAVAAGFNWHASGSPFTFPISVAGGENTFGFGTKSVGADTAGVEYSLADGLSSTASNLYAVVQWLPGGWAIVALAAIGLVRARTAAAAFCVTMTGAFALGYTFWFANELTVAGAIRGIGPHYHLPVLVGLCGLAGLGLAHVITHRPRSGLVLATALVVVAVAHQAYYWPDRVDDKDFVTSINAEWADTAAAVPVGAEGTMVIMGDEKPRYLLDEAPTVGNDGYDTDTPVLYVNDTDPAALASVVDQRTVWLLWAQHDFVPDVRAAEQTLTTSACVAVTVPVPDGRVVQYAGEGGDRPTVAVRGDTVTWRLGSDGVVLGRETLAWPGQWGTMKLGLAIETTAGPGSTPVDEELREMWVRYSVNGDHITVVAPGQIWSTGPAHLDPTVSTC